MLGPWAIEVDGLLDELVVEKLPDALVATLAPVLEERKAHREEKLSEHQAREEAAARLEGLGERIAELGAEELGQVLTRTSRRRGRAGCQARASFAISSKLDARRSRPSRATSCRGPRFARGVDRGLRAGPRRSSASEGRPVPLGLIAQHPPEASMSDHKLFSQAAGVSPRALAERGAGEK